LALSPQVPQFDQTPNFSALNYVPGSALPVAPEPVVVRPSKHPAVPAYVPARVLTKVMPDGQQLALAVHDISQVQLRIRIGNDGRVEHVHVVQDGTSANGVVTQASIEAVKQWTFRPAQDFGKDVASDYVVILHFAPRTQP
jgi:outer membrane biosynthesis protein TonB